MCRAAPSGRCERGQASVEWIGLVALVALLLLATLVALPRGLPGSSIGHTIADRIVCAVARTAERCRAPRDELTARYGAEVAALVRENAPNIAYENGMKAVPIDFRKCLADPACADAVGEPWGVSHSSAGHAATAFVRVIDRRAGGGALYLQYWLYYADSATLRGVPVVGAKGYHRHDWESYQLRLRPGQLPESRASSHHGYNHKGGIHGWPSDLRGNQSAWRTATGWLLVSGGSHAGRIHGDPGDHGTVRVTSAADLRLVPIEPIAETDRTSFAPITPPWAKPVYTDPESTKT